MSLHALRHVVVDAVHAADGAFAQRLSRAGLLRVDERGYLGKFRVGLGAPHADAAADRGLVDVEHLAGLGKRREGIGRSAGSADGVGHVLVEGEAVGVDPLGQRHRRRLDEHAVEIGDAHGGFDGGGLRVHGRQLVKLDEDAGLLHVLILHAGGLVKVLGLEDVGFAHLDRIAEVGKVPGEVAIAQIREHEVLDQAGQGASCDGLEGNKFIGHMVSFLSSGCGGHFWPPVL